MSVLKIGSLQPDLPLGQRDAFHVPVVLVQCELPMHGGDWVRFVDETFTHVRSSGRGKDSAHGMIDPFLDHIPSGQKFFVLLKPGTISERLTHHFDINIPDVAKVEPDEPDEDYEDQCKGCW